MNKDLLSIYYVSGIVWNISFTSPNYPNLFDIYHGTTLFMQYFLEIISNAGPKLL